MKSEAVARIIVDAARITRSDVVLEVGTGRGILTKLLCVAAKHVISIESDRNLYRDAVLQIRRDNLEIVCYDGFRTNYTFSIFVSNLPYSKSRKAVEWLAERNFTRAIIMVQKEFACKLLTKSRRERRAVTVIANYTFKIDEIASINRDSFDPPPRVDSTLLLLEKKRTIPRDMIDAVNTIFSYRRKVLHNILREAGEKTDDRRRLEDLTDEEVMGIAVRIAS